MKTFEFTLTTAEGHSYKYTGSVESLAAHLKANSHLGITVVEEETRFSDQAL